MKQLLLIAGTRPNFIKLAPLYHRLKLDAGFKLSICHTGQHFDFNMSDIFWQNLELPAPDFQLNIKGTGVVDTIGKSILGINEVIKNNLFDLIIVFGDVNATVAGAIAGVQSHIPVMHVEAGLRSFDREMPEEINRIITDHICNYLIVSEPSGIKNLQKEGFEADKYCMAGNIMIECLLNTRTSWEKTKLSNAAEVFYQKRPIVATFHRPENVDNKNNLQRMVNILMALAASHPIVFPVHPRTRAMLDLHGFMDILQKEAEILIIEPLSYFEFLKLVSNARLVITDSGGVQEETSFLNVPCVTFRKNTERPITVELGTNLMMSIWEETFIEKIETHIKNINNRNPQKIPMWDNEVSSRIINFIRMKM